MKQKLIFIFIWLLLPAAIFAQGLLNNGSSVVIRKGGMMVIHGANGGYTNQTSLGTDGKVYLDGVMKINGNWTNNSNGDVFANPDTAGLVRFSFSGTPDIGGTKGTKFENLTIDAGTSAEMVAGSEVTALFTLTSNGNLIVNGDLYIHETFINNATISGTGTVHYKGTGNQTIAAADYTDLELGATGIMTLGGDISIADTLSLTAGHVLLGDHTLTFGVDAVCDTLTATGWIDASDSGSVVKMYDQPGTFTFPVGDDTLRSPVFIDLKQANFSNGLINLRVRNTVHPDNNTGLGFSNYLNRYWNIRSSGMTNLMYDATFWYDTADVHGSEDSIKGARYDATEPGNWRKFNLVNKALHNFSAAGQTVFSDFTGIQATFLSNLLISGYARYENNPKTPLGGLKITLYKDAILQTTCNTNASGFYSFDSLAGGQYSLSVASASPSGQWQTWGGVNMTDYLLTYKHVTSGPQLPSLPPVVRISGDVKAPQSPPVINAADASAIQMAAKYGWGNPPYFQIPKWVFSGVTGTIDNIPVTSTSISFDLRGLCAGDVNGSYLPGSGYKMTIPDLALENRGMIPVTEEMIFPVHADRDMEPGAITLFINYDPSSIEITGVTIPGNTGNEPYFEVNEGVLFIGWISTESLPAEENQPLLMIRARLAGATDLIRFTLNDNPLSELADAEGNVIQNLKLFIPDAGSSVNACGLLPVALYPNPAQDDLMVEMAAPADGTVTLELVTLQGVSQMKQNTFVQAGWNKITLNMQNLSNGTYLLKVITGERTEVRKVIVNR